ncbi:hypothetical protein MP228_012084 [Amoeboaphelidium protococcarum]|nr:hypothetical protein MP228_012084 [Amoeboaphelidium protococcarum]
MDTSSIIGKLFRNMDLFQQDPLLLKCFQPITKRFTNILLSHYSSPQVINDVIVEVAEKQAIVSSQSKRLQALLGALWNSYLPLSDEEYLSKAEINGDMNYSSSEDQKDWADRQKYLDSLLKNVKRCKSTIDAQQVIYNLHIEIAQMKTNYIEVQNKKMLSIDDFYDKYYKQLGITLNKYLKRIKVLESGDSSEDMDTSGMNSVGGSLFELSQSAEEKEQLKKVLMDYHQKKGEKLFYFLQFLQETGAENKVKFWLDAQSVLDMVPGDDVEMDDTLWKEVKQAYLKLCQSYLTSGGNTESSPGIHLLLRSATILRLKQLQHSMEQSSSNLSDQLDLSSLTDAQNEIVDDLNRNELSQFIKSEYYIKMKSSEYEYGHSVQFSSPVSGSSIDGAIDGAAAPNDENTPIHKQTEEDIEKSDMIVTLRRLMKRVVLNPDLESQSPMTPLLSNPSAMSLDNISGKRVGHQWRAPSLDNFLPSISLPRPKFLSPGVPTPNSGVAKSQMRASTPVYSESQLSSDSDLVPASIKIEVYNKQLALLDYLMKKDIQLQKYQFRIKVYKRCAELIRKQLLDLTERKMLREHSDNLLDGHQSDYDFTRKVKWSVAVTPSQNARDGVYFLDVVRTDVQLQLPKSWIVPRRYGDFVSLNQVLREQYDVLTDMQGISKLLELNNKNLIPRIRSEDFNRERYLAVVKYLQFLIEDEAISQSRELREFLNEGKYHRQGPLARRSAKLAKLLESDNSTGSGSNSGQRKNPAQQLASLLVGPNSPKTVSGGGGQSTAGERERRPLFEHITALAESTRSVSPFKQLNRMMSGTQSSTKNHPLVSAGFNSSSSPSDRFSAVSSSSEEGSSQLIAMQIDDYSDTDQSKPSGGQEQNQDMLQSPYEEDVDLSPGKNSVRALSTDRFSERATSVASDELILGSIDDHGGGGEGIMSPDQDEYRNRGLSAGGSSVANSVFSKTSSHQHSANLDQLVEDQLPGSNDYSNTKFTSLSQPMCEALLNIFQFKESNALLRESAALLLLKRGVFAHRSVTSTELHIQKALNYVISEDCWMKAFDFLTEKVDMIWPRRQGNSDVFGQNDDLNRAKAQSLRDNQLKVLVEPAYDVDDSTQIFHDEEEDERQGNITTNMANSKSLLGINDNDFANSNLRLKRSSSEDLRAKIDARNKLLHLLPDSFVKILGWEQTAEGFKKIFEKLQSKDNNRKLVLLLLDSMIDELQIQD